MPKGGAREGAGRKRGIPNKVTADIRALAGKYGPAAIKRIAELAGIMPKERGKAESQQVQFLALKELVDRGYGKARQEVTGEGGGPLQHHHKVDLTNATDEQLDALETVFGPLAIDDDGGDPSREGSAPN